MCMGLDGIDDVTGDTARVVGLERMDVAMTSTNTTGTVTPINVPYPDARDLHLRISEGACRITITPGDGDAWITGTHEDPTGARPLHIEQEGGTVRITEDPHMHGMWGWLRAGGGGHGGIGIPSFKLVLGKRQPFSLTVEVGASENRLDLGGLPINRLSLKHGAGDTSIDFSAPNPEGMTLLEVSAGAGNTTLKSLAQANCQEYLIDGGMAAFTLDFSGTLQRDAHARISTGFSSVSIAVPVSTAAKITAEASLGHVEADTAFIHHDGGLWTQAAVDGKTPVLTIAVQVSLGALTLRAL